MDADGTNVRSSPATARRVAGRRAGRVAPMEAPGVPAAAPREAGQEYDRVAIEVVDLATGATRVVAVSPVAEREYVEYVGPRWSPDGSQIVFTVMRYPVPPTDENILGSSIDDRGCRRLRS